MARAMLPIELERITAQINKLLFQVEAIEKEGDCHVTIPKVNFEQVQQ